MQVSSPTDWLHSSNVSTYLIVTLRVTLLPSIALVRLFHTRRNPDPAQKQRILDAANVVSDVAVKHLSPRNTGTYMCIVSGHDIAQSRTDDKRNLFTYYATMLTLCSILLIDGKLFFFTAVTVSTSLDCFKNGRTRRFSAQFSWPRSIAKAGSTLSSTCAVSSLLPSKRLHQSPPRRDRRYRSKSSYTLKEG